MTAERLTPEQIAEGERFLDDADALDAGKGFNVFARADSNGWLEANARAIFATLHAQGERIKELEPWKDAIMDAAVVHWTLAAGHEDNPRMAVHALMCCAAEWAQDPEIDSGAAKLRDTYLAERDAAIRRAGALAAQFSRLPPYDEDGFYVDHGQWGRERASVAAVMDSLRGALAAIDAAIASERDANANLD